MIPEERGVQGENYAWVLIQTHIPEIIIIMYKPSNFLLSVPKTNH
jgi:hypothetical protein